MLILYRRVVFGPVTNPAAAEMPDLNRREFFILAPVSLLVILLGVFPNFVMERIAPSAERVITLYEKGIGEAPAETVEPAAGEITP